MHTFLEKKKVFYGLYFPSVYCNHLLLCVVSFVWIRLESGLLPRVSPRMCFVSGPPFRGYLLGCALTWVFLCFCLPFLGPFRSRVALASVCVFQVLLALEMESPARDTHTGSFCLPSEVPPGLLSSGRAPSRLYVLVVSVAGDACVASQRHWHHGIRLPCRLCFPVLPPCCCLLITLGRVPVFFHGHRLYVLLSLNPD